MITERLKIAVRRMFVILLLILLVQYFGSELSLIPNEIFLVLIGAQAFLSSFQLQEEVFEKVQDRKMYIFIAGRFIALPVLLYLIFLLVLPRYSESVFLLSLIPPGFSTPYFSGVFGGDLALSRKIFRIASGVSLLLFLSFLFFTAPFQIFQSALVGVLLSVVLPFLIHLPLRKNDIYKEKFTALAVEMAPLIVATILIFGITKVASISSGISFEFVKAGCIAFGVFALFYLYPFTLFSDSTDSEKISYFFASGVINITLGIALAVLYLNFTAINFMMASAMAWFVSFLVLGLGVN